MAPDPPGAEDAPAGSLAIRDVAEAVGLITAPAAGLAALALYFGWKRTTLALGVVLLLYATLALRTGGETSVAVPNWMRVLAIVFCSLLVAAGLFAATDEYAESVGTREAELTAALLDGRRGVIVYSREDLGLPGSVTCRSVGGKTSAFRFRCDGLRLFVRTSNATLVLPATWSRLDGPDQDDRIIAIPDDDGIRLEFTPGRDDLLFESR